MTNVNVNETFVKSFLDQDSIVNSISAQSDTSTIPSTSYIEQKVGKYLNTMGPYPEGGHVLSEIDTIGTFPIADAYPGRYADLPDDWSTGSSLLIVKGSNSSTPYKFQILMNWDNRIWLRHTVNGKDYSEWELLERLTISQVNTLIDTALSNLSFVTEQDMKDYTGLAHSLKYPSDINDVTSRGVYNLYLVSNNDGTMRYDNLPSDFTNGVGILIVLYSDDNSPYFYQVLITTKGTLYTRSHITSYSSWSKINSSSSSPSEITIDLVNEEIRSNDLLTIFPKIGVIGDSLASGQGRINDYTHMKDFYEFSWPQFMARQFNITVYNFTLSGLSTRTWLTSSMGLSLMQQSDKKAQAYIIGLGANDIGLGASYLGQQSDVHPTNPSLNADTYYGNYGKIISAIKEIEPRAKIFVLTNPSYGNSSLRQQFNVAVRYMPTVFTNTYLIDLSESQFQSGFIDANKVSSHFTPAGYKFIATIIAREISKIIYNNASDFWFSNLIGTEYADPS